MEDYNKAIGEWLAKERKRQNISQRQMAEKMGVSKSAIHYWETGKRTIYAETVFEYCDALHADVNQLFWDVTHQDNDFYNVQTASSTNNVSTKYAAKDFDDYDLDDFKDKEE